MADAFTDRANRILRLSIGEAQRLHRDAIDTEHVLLGLLRVGRCPAHRNPTAGALYPIDGGPRIHGIWTSLARRLSFRRSTRSAPDGTRRRHSCDFFVPISASRITFS